MTVRQFDKLHKLEYKSIVDRLVETTVFKPKNFYIFLKNT